MRISARARGEHRRWLFELTQIPTAAGREHLVVEWIERWCAARSDVVLKRDGAGNVVLLLRGDEALGAARPVYLTAHLDHPAFVVERVVAPTVLEMSFRGGVMDEYFAGGGEGARVRVYGRDERAYSGVVTGKASETKAWKVWTVELVEGTEALTVGDIGRWELAGAEEIDGCIHTDACDDLSTVAAALAALDVLREGAVSERRQSLRVLFTRAEEIGFIGAIAASREGTIERGARVIALENSRSFADSPIGGGPIVRVGDRLSVFSPSLTAAVVKCAEGLAGASPAVSGTVGKSVGAGNWKWQRKLMSGGACEASVYCQAGYEATCVCLALGNYHNMGNLDAVQAGGGAAAARVAREFVSLADYDGLVDLLVACGESLPEAPGIGGLVERLWSERAWVLDDAVRR